MEAGGWDAAAGGYSQDESGYPYWEQRGAEYSGGYENDAYWGGHESYQTNDVVASTITSGPSGNGSPGSGTNNLREQSLGVGGGASGGGGTGRSGKAIVEAEADPPIVADAQEQRERRDFYGNYTEKMLGNLQTSEEVADDGDSDSEHDCASVERELARAWQEWVGVARPVPPPDLKARLICFPWAGGTSLAYRDWGLLLPGVEVVAIQLPGRLTRVAEAAVESIPELVDPIVEALRGLQMITKGAVPFSLFGHELGALIAFEVCRKVRSDTPAQALFVSGMCCPQARRFFLYFVASGHAGQMTHARVKISDLCHVSETGEVLHAKNLEFDKALRERGGLPADVEENVNLLMLFVPLWYSDLRALDTYDYVGAPPLECPIYGFGGSFDENLMELSSWSMETTSSEQRWLQYPGGLFYLTARENEADMLEFIYQRMVSDREGDDLDAQIEALLDSDDDHPGDSNDNSSSASTSRSESNP